MIKLALLDIRDGISRADLWLFLGWHEIRQRYRRSSLGPFWITLATLLFVGAMSAVYSALFRQDLASFLPFVATGMVIWGFISSCLTDGPNIFIAAGPTIKQVPAPLMIHVFRAMWQQLIFLAHNMVVVAIAVGVGGVSIGLVTLLFIPALILLVVNLTWMALTLAVVAARFRDVPLVVQSFVSALFLVTPVLWRIDFLPPERQWVALVNPFTYLVELARAPLLGAAPPLYTWLFNIGFAAAGWLFATAIYARSRNKVAYWI